MVTTDDIAGLIIDELADKAGNSKKRSWVAGVAISIGVALVGYAAYEIFFSKNKKDPKMANFTDTEKERRALAAQQGAPVR